MKPEEAVEQYESRRLMASCEDRVSAMVALMAVVTDVLRQDAAALFRHDSEALSRWATLLVELAREVNNAAREGGAIRPRPD